MSSVVVEDSKSTDRYDTSGLAPFERPEWKTMYMRIALQSSARSSCLRLQTASLLVRNQRIVATGYNGTISGETHCCDYWMNEYKTKYEKDHKTFKEFLQSETFSREHHSWSTRHEVHGEQNAILYTARTNAAATEGAEMYTVYSPCINCSKAIAAAGIVRVYYHDLYKRDTSGIEFLEKHGIGCEQVHIDEDETLNPLANRTVPHTH